MGVGYGELKDVELLGAIQIQLSLNTTPYILPKARFHLSLETNVQFLLQMFIGDHFFLHSAQSLLLQSLSQELHRITSEMKY